MLVGLAGSRRSGRHQRRRRQGGRGAAACRRQRAAAGRGARRREHSWCSFLPPSTSPDSEPIGLVCCRRWEDIRLHSGCSLCLTSWVLGRWSFQRSPDACVPARLKPPTGSIEQNRYVRSVRYVWNTPVHFAAVIFQLNFARVHSFFDLLRSAAVNIDSNTCVHSGLHCLSCRPCAHASSRPSSCHRMLGHHHLCAHEAASSGVESCAMHFREIPVI